MQRTVEKSENRIKKIDFQISECEHQIKVLQSKINVHKAEREVEETYAKSLRELVKQKE